MLKHWIWLSMALIPGGRGAHNYRDYFSSAEDVFDAEMPEIMKIDGLNRSEIDKLRLKKLKRAEEIEEHCKNNNIEIITYNSEKYPNSLKSIYAPPVVLYVRGKTPDFNNTPMFTIVGTRKATKEGERTAYEFACKLSNAGCMVVSGMADGIDAAANRGALAGKTPTLAVLGCGVDVVYPAGNAELMNRIMEKGAVISEFPPDYRPMPHFFIMRNRIMAGLGMGTLVIEAPKVSGALITADLTLDAGKDVFAVPGSIYNKNYEGSNLLIKEGGAIFVTEVEDIIPYLPVRFEEAAQSEQSTLEDRLEGISSPAERKIAELLHYHRELHIDEIARLLDISEPQLVPSIMMLEIYGIVKNIGGDVYAFLE